MTDSKHTLDPRIFEGIRHALDLSMTGEPGLAVQHLSVLILEFPEVASLHGYLSLLLVDSGQLDQAVEHGRKAVQLSPESEKASFFFSRALWANGEHIAALEEMKRFITIEPSKIYSQMIKEWDLGTSGE